MIDSARLEWSRKWWRHLIKWGVGFSVVVNGVVLPIVYFVLNGELIDLLGLAAIITACAPIVAVREWGKVKQAQIDEHCPEEAP